MFGLKIGVGLIFWGFIVRVVKYEVVLDIFGSNTKMKCRQEEERKVEKAGRLEKKKTESILEFQHNTK